MLVVANDLIGGTAVHHREGSATAADFEELFRQILLARPAGGTPQPSRKALTTASVKVSPVSLLSLEANW